MSEVAQEKRETDQEEWDRKQQEKLAEHEERQARLSRSENAWLRDPKRRTGETQETQESVSEEATPSEQSSEPQSE
jgi:hypothetical protein